MPGAGTLNPYVDAEITISSTALNIDATDFAPFTAEQIAKADVIHIRVYDATVRYRYAGTAVTTTTGYAIEAGSEIELVGRPVIEKFSIIAETGDDATLWVTLLTYRIPPS